MTKSIDRQLLLNQVAQGIHAVDDLLKEVDVGDSHERLAWFDDLAMAVSQSHPQPTEVEQAIVESGVKATLTPSVLLRANPLGQALSTMRELPTHETHTTFRLLVTLLGISDGRRRASCDGDCHHWWHQDLRDSVVVRSLLR
jgi:hypothetical protein